eukprot:7093200-Prymnesium_polylepis.1
MRALAAIAHAASIAVRALRASGVRRASERGARVRVRVRACARACGVRARAVCVCVRRVRGGREGGAHEEGGGVYARPKLTTFRDSLPLSHTLASLALACA